MTTNGHGHSHNDHSHAAKDMADACAKFLDSMSADQKAKATFHYNDGERIFWYYPPMNRHGLPLRDMDENQRKLAYDLMATGLTDSANTRAQQIIAHESILGAMEKDAGIKSFVRDPELYYWTVFGDPRSEDPWGWRVEGHHVSLHIHVWGDEVISTTPFFFGANPAVVPAGRTHEGRAILSSREELGLELFNSLDAGQRSKAVIAEETPWDIYSYNASKPVFPVEVGLPGSAMNGGQQEMLMSLVSEYVSQVREDVAGTKLEKIRDQGMNNFHFAWAGGSQHGEKHYYRVHSGNFVVEYDNRQNDANHIHSVIRDVENDFGVDVLREHLLLYHVI